LTAPVVAGVGGGLGALGTGLATGATLASGAGIFSNFMAGAAPGLAGTLGGVSAPVAASIAPAATSQLMGTIGGSVAPGAFGANLAGATSGLTSALPGATSGLTSVLPNATSQFAQVAPNLAGREQIIQAFSQPNLGQNLTQLGPKLAGDATASSLTPQVTTSPYDLSTGFKGLTKSPTFAGTSSSGLQINNPALSLQTPGTNTISETGQLIADPRSEILGRGIRPNQNFFQNLGNIGSFQDVKDYAQQHPVATAGIATLAGQGLKKLFEQKGVGEPESNAMIRPYTYERTQSPDAYAVSPTQDSSERLYFNDQFVAGEPYKAAGGGIVSLAIGGPVEQMANMNSVGMNTGYPMANLQTPVYSNPDRQRPEATNIIAPSADVGVTSYSGEPRFAEGGEAKTEGGYKYSYDPNTMQFTQTGGPGVSKTPTGEELAQGVAAHDMLKRFNEHILTGNPYNSTPSFVSGATPRGRVTGGIATPVMGPTQAQAQPQRPATPINVPAYQSPEQQLGLSSFYDMMSQQLGGFGDYAGYAAGGGIGGASHLGDYSDGGRLLKGPGDGVSDSIPASIGDRQPARLADGEFVVPARIVSELGNGSTEAGARKLYAMMDRVQNARKKSVGKKNVAVNSKADKYLPA
jgi:hypothetical protein